VWDQLIEEESVDRVSGTFGINFCLGSVGSVLIVALRVPVSAVSSGFVNTPKLSVKLEYIEPSLLFSLALSLFLYFAFEGLLGLHCAGRFEFCCDVFGLDNWDLQPGQWE